MTTGSFEKPYIYTPKTEKGQPKTETDQAVNKDCQVVIAGCGIENFVVNRMKKGKKEQTPDQAMESAIAFLKKLVASVPAFASCRSFVVSPGLQLTFEDGPFSFALFPEFFGIAKDELQPGQTVQLAGEWIAGKSEFKNIRAVDASNVQEDGVCWTDGSLIAVGSAPKNLKPRRREDFYLIKKLVPQLLEKLKGADVETIDAETYPLFIENDCEEIVRIGSGYFSRKRLDFIVKNTDARKKTSFLVAEKSLVAIQKNGEIVVILAELRPDKMDTIVLAGMWKAKKGTIKNPAICIPLADALKDKEEEQPA